MNDTSQKAVHWQRTKNLMIVHLIIWFVFSYLIHFIADALYPINFLGWPLNYYMAAQGSLIVFVVQLFLFAKQQHAIDVKFGVAEQEE